MAINTISYTVSTLGLEPNTKQFGGVQGDHNKLRLNFTIEQALWDKLQEEKVNAGTLYYRFDLHNGEGAKSSSEPQVLENLLITFDVEEWLTRFGGVGKVELVITLCEDSETHLELYSFPALLQFKNRTTGSEPDANEYRSMTTLAMMAKEAANKAETSRLQAQAASDSANDVRTALDRGMLLKLDGKRAGGLAEIFKSISGEITQTGQNPVSGAAVYAALYKLYTNLSGKISEMQSSVFLAAHPVGSLYWSSDGTSPERLFGGTWEQIKGVFIYAANDGDEINGDIQGNKDGTVMLAEENIAPHKHYGLNLNGAATNVYRSVSTSLKGVSLQRNVDGAIYSSEALCTGLNKAKDENNKEIAQKAVNIMPPYKAYYCWIRTE